MKDSATHVSRGGVVAGNARAVDGVDSVRNGVFRGEAAVLRCQRRVGGGNVHGVR